MLHGSGDPGAFSPCPALHGFLPQGHLVSVGMLHFQSAAGRKAKRGAHTACLGMCPGSRTPSSELAFGHTWLQWRLASTVFILNSLCFAKKQGLGFPGGAVVENLPANAGDTGSSPGLGRSHVPRSSWAREPQLLSLRIWSLCSTTREAATVRGLRTTMKGGPHSPQPEKALAQKRRPNTTK